jgi:DNA-binding beta-propeller fold protein YncE
MMHPGVTARSKRAARTFAAGVLLAVGFGIAGAFAGAIPTVELRVLFSIQDGLALPSDVAIGTGGRVYIVDGGNHRVAVFDRAGKPLFHIGARGSAPGQFRDPVGIGIGPQGSVYVADKGNQRIQVFSAEGAPQGSFPVRVGGKPVAPVDVAVDAAGKTLYVTGNSNHKLMAFTPDGRLLRQWGGEGVNRGEFRYPACVAIGPDGRVYVVDVLNTRVQAFDPSGQIFTVGEWGVLPGQLFRPKGVAIDRQGRVYVSDSYLDVLQVFSSAYKFLHVLGSAGKPHPVVAPGGIAIDDGNRLYVAEMLKNRVTVFELSP